MSMPGYWWLRRWLSPRRRLAWYPPFRCLGVQVIELRADWRVVSLRLPLTARTRNPGGALFGGAIASVADPIAALACAKRFPGMSVWTRALNVDFLREGRSDLDLRFRFPEGQESQIRTELQTRGRSTPVFDYGLYDCHGELCVRVRNTVAIRPAGYQPDGNKLRQ